jgi:hypothetical protein
MLEIAYARLSELLMNPNLSIMNVIYVGLLLFCVSGWWIVGLENVKMIDDEICYRTKECKFVKHTWQ